MIHEGRGRPGMYHSGQQAKARMRMASMSVAGRKNPQKVAKREKFGHGGGRSAIGRHQPGY
jgi:hypothetical protein